MDAELWAPVIIAAIGALSGVLAYLGRRADRREKAKSAVVSGYDRLTEDLQATLSEERKESARWREEAARLRMEGIELRAENAGLHRDLAQARAELVRRRGGRGGGGR